MDNMATIIAGDVVQFAGNNVGSVREILVKPPKTTAWMAEYIHDAGSAKTIVPTKAEALDWVEAKARQDNRMTVTLHLSDAQATLMQRALEDAVDVCSDHYNQLCADGATEGELESARRNHRQAADLANALERARLRVAPRRPRRPVAKAE